MKKLEAWTILRGIAANEPEAVQAWQSLLGPEVDEFNAYQAEIEQDLKELAEDLDRTLDSLYAGETLAPKTATEAIEIFQKLEFHLYEEILVATLLRRNNALLLLDEVKPNAS